MRQGLSFPGKRRAARAAASADTAVVAAELERSRRGLVREVSVLFSRLYALDRGEGRCIGLSEELWSLIERRSEARSVLLASGETLLASYVFHRLGGRISDLRKAWKKACAAAGLVGRLFHDLRRTGIRRLRAAGVPENVAMKISGHKTAATFKRYDIVDPNDTREALEQAASGRKKPGRVLPIRGKKSGR